MGQHRRCQVIIGAIVLQSTAEEALTKAKAEGLALVRADQDPTQRRMSAVVSYHGVLSPRAQDEAVAAAAAAAAAPAAAASSAARPARRFLIAHGDADQALHGVQPPLDEFPRPVERVDDEEGRDRLPMGRGLLFGDQRQVGEGVSQSGRDQGVGLLIGLYAPA